MLFCSKRVTKLGEMTHVADRHRFDADPDPDPTFSYDANPDPYPDPDSDPTLKVSQVYN